jgi:hypothetical protein
MATIAPVPGNKPFSDGMLGSRLVAMKRAPDCSFDLLECDVAIDACYNYLNIVFSEDEALLFEGLSERGHPENMNTRTDRVITAQVAGRCLSGNQDRGRQDIDTHACHLLGTLPRRAGRIVGYKHKMNVMSAEEIKELHQTRQRLIAAVQDPVHIEDQVGNTG